MDRYIPPCRDLSGGGADPERGRFAGQLDQRAALSPCITMRTPILLRALHGTLNVTSITDQVSAI